MAVYEKSDNLTPARKWSFRQFVSLTGRHVIEDWRGGMPQGPFRAVFDTFLRTLAKTETWPSGWIEPLRGKKYSGLTELRWTAGKVEHRIIGYQLSDADSQHRYQMLIGCTHKGRIYTPANSLDSAVDRKKMIETGKATTSEYQLIADR